MKHLSAILGILGIFLISAVTSLPTAEGVPLCFIKYFTGWDCPGCGLTRGFIALFHGQWSQAIRFNPVAPILVIFFLVYFCQYIYEWITSKSPAWFTDQGRKVISRLFLVLLLGQWILKSGKHLFSILSI